VAPESAKVGWTVPQLSPRPAHTAQPPKSAVRLATWLMEVPMSRQQDRPGGKARSTCGCRRAAASCNGEAAASRAAPSAPFEPACRRTVIAAAWCGAHHYQLPRDARSHHASEAPPTPAANQWVCVSQRRSVQQTQHCPANTALHSRYARMLGGSLAA